MALKIIDTDPEGVLKTAVKLALKGARRSQTEVHADWEPYCDDPVKVVRSRRSANGVKGVEVSFFAPCRRCAKCLQFRQMKWRERALIEHQQAPRTWFVTLTFSPHHLAGIIAESYRLPVESRVKAIDRAAYEHIKRYFKRLRKAGHRFRYLAVYERGEETGRSHYHLLLHEISRPIPKRDIEAQWRSHVHCRLVADDGRGTASYITKYATKSLDVAPRASLHYGALRAP